MTAQRAFRLLRWSAAVLAAGILITPVASAQSLADVARQEQARRKDAAAGRVYTNESLPAVEPPPAAAPARTATVTPGGDPGQDDVTPRPDGEPQDAPAAAQPGEPGAPAGEKAGEKKDEAYWRARIAAEREALERAESFAEALQSRINALSVDFVNRDDPAQRNLIAADRQKALDELDRVRKEIAEHTREIENIQQEARRAGVPRGWLR